MQSRTLCDRGSRLEVLVMKNKKYSTNQIETGNKRQSRTLCDKGSRLNVLFMKKNYLLHGVKQRLRWLVDLPDYLGEWVK